MKSTVHFALNSPALRDWNWMFSGCMCLITRKIGKIITKNSAPKNSSVLTTGSSMPKNARAIKELLYIIEYSRQSFWKIRSDPYRHSSLEYERSYQFLVNSETSAELGRISAKYSIPNQRCIIHIPLQGVLAWSRNKNGDMLEGKRLDSFRKLSVGSAVLNYYAKKCARSLNQFACSSCWALRFFNGKNIDQRIFIKFCFRNKLRIRNRCEW